MQGLYQSFQTLRDPENCQADLWQSRICNEFVKPRNALAEGDPPEPLIAQNYPSPATPRQFDRRGVLDSGQGLESVTGLMWAPASKCEEATGCPEVALGHDNGL